MTFSVLHTSARPQQWKAVYKAWMKAADHPERLQYILVCDRRWGFVTLPEFSYDYHRENGDRCWIDGLALWNTGRRCYVDGVNIGAAYATGDILIVNADDQFPCEHWDSELLRTRSLTSEFVIEVRTNTPSEHERGIMVMPVLSKALYQKRGYVFYPSYESMYADNDFCEQARAEGIVTDARHLIFPHKHPIVDASQPWDKAYAEQNRKEAYDRGLAILQKRRGSNFSDVQVIVPQVRAKDKMACVLPGESFSQPWVGNWTEIVSMLSENWDLNVQFGFSSNVYFTRQSMANTLIPLKAKYILWIDDDQILSREGLQLLFEDLEKHPQIDVVVGWAWCQSQYYGSGPMLSCGGWKVGKPIRMTYDELMAGEEDLKPVSFSGMPAVLMRGEALGALGPRSFMPILDEDLFPPFGMSGEDAAFFLRAHEKGLKCAVDRRVKVPHLKLGCPEPAVQAPVGAVTAVKETGEQNTDGNRIVHESNGHHADGAGDASALAGSRSGGV